MIVDPKVVALFNETHVAQMIVYQNITGLDLALIRVEAGIAAATVRGMHAT